MNIPNNEHNAESVPMGTTFCINGWERHKTVNILFLVVSINNTFSLCVSTFFRTTQVSKIESISIFDFSWPKIATSF